MSMYAKSPSGAFAPVICDSRGGLAIGYGDGPSLDAFSRARVSEPVTIFSSQSQYDAEPLLYESGASGNGTAAAHSANTRMSALAAGATGTSWIQSHEYIPYQPGKSQLIFITGVLGAGVAGATVDVGSFDANNGFFLRQNGTAGLQLVRRSKTSGSVVNEVVDQADWSEDSLDGTGPSGITIDETKAFILGIDAQYLGMGRCRVYFDSNGQLIEVHHFEHANIIAVPYMQSLALPVQMLVTSTGTEKTAYFKCASVSSEGGLSEDLAYHFGTREQTVTAANGARTHILSLRPLTTFNSIENRCRLVLNSIEVLVTGNSPVYLELCIGTQFTTAPTWEAVNATYSSAQQTTVPGLSTTAWAGAAAGTVIAAGYNAASAQSKSVTSARLSQRYPITLDKAGAVRDNGTLSLLVSGLGGTSVTRATFNYSEVR